MIEACMSSPASAALLTESVKILLSVASVSLSVALIFAARHAPVRLKPALVYSHIALLIFPLVLFVSHSTCGYFCLSCHSNPTHLAAIAVPTAFILSSAAGLFFIPSMLVRANSGRRLEAGGVGRLIERSSRRLGTVRPEVFATDSAGLQAFSFGGVRSAIFLSVGALETLTRKEIEAVLLHEMMHIKRGSSSMKLSGAMLRLFSPFSLWRGFCGDMGREERLADAFAARFQGTRRHLESAKAKFAEFEKRATKNKNGHKRRVH